MILAALLAIAVLIGAVQRRAFEFVLLPVTVYSAAVSRSIFTAFAFSPSNHVWLMSGSATVFAASFVCFACLMIRGYKQVTTVTKKDILIIISALPLVLFPYVVIRLTYGFHLKMPELSLLSLLSLLFLLLSAFLEEGFFRFYLLDVVSVYFGKTAAILIVSAAFSVAHLEPNASILSFSLLFHFAFSGVLCLMRNRTKGIFALGAIHFISNVVLRYL